MKSTTLLTGITVAAIVLAGLFMSTSNDSEVSANIALIARDDRIPASVAPVLQRACRDCHSNDTVWPWYSHIPPMSFMITRDVERGRGRFNFSPWAEGLASPTASQAQEICDAVSDGSMPPNGYRMMHREARLSSDDVETLCRWANVAASARK